MPTPSVQSVPAPSGERDAALENFINAVAAGDREALGQLYEETRTAVFAFALSIVKDRQDAEDILQEVYVKVWQSAPSYRPMGKPMAWILTITRRFALMDLRRKERAVPVTPEDWERMFADERTPDAEDALILGSLLELLEEDEREIVVLHAVAGMKHRESAQILDMGLSTVLSKYSRALKKLRRALGEVQ